MNQPFSLLIKPASADCNLACDYCFYLGKCALYPETRKHRMSDETLETLVRKYMKTSQPIYSFGWQGGEPTLMGAGFFEKAIEFQKKYGRSGASVGNGLQTNATLIDDTMAAFFSEYKFLAGCSLDGSPEIHNRYRQTVDHRGSYDRAIQGIRLLEKHGVEFNILVLVSQANVKCAADVYHYLLDKGYYFHQYIPCVEFDAEGQLLPFAISGAEWGEFLCELYDCWYPKDTRKVSIRQFDAILNKTVEGIANVCTMGDNCNQYFVVEYNGDIYPCDFFVDPPLKIGNILENSWDEMLNSPRYKQFGRQKIEWNARCSECEYLFLCQGDCLKHRLVVADDSPARLSHLCEGWKKFYAHSLNGFENLTREIKEERARELSNQAKPPGNMPRRTQKIGRNDPCPCGSGLKYKKCCFPNNPY